MTSTDIYNHTRGRDLINSDQIQVKSLANSKAKKLSNSRTLTQDAAAVLARQPTQARRPIQPRSKLFVQLLFTLILALDQVTTQLL